jgi:hypothetical protein
MNLKLEPKKDQAKIYGNMRFPGAMENKFNLQHKEPSKPLFFFS